MLLSEEGCNNRHLMLIDGILELEMHRICGQLSFEQLSGKAFSGLLQRAVQKELTKFGIHLYDLQMNLTSERSLFSTPECLRS